MDVVLLVFAYFTGALGLGVAIGRVLSTRGYAGEPTPVELRLIEEQEAARARERRAPASGAVARPIRA